ncbi:MAG TPA: response regulator [Burkholderiaceae bacterium]|nr:response regulator [Burkholderiaceae bacterium]
MDKPAARTLRVLHIEDSELDHELTMTQLRRAGLDIDALRVETRAEFERALREGRHGLSWDVILSDYNLPGFSGLMALDMLRASGLLIPFIIVSGEIGEDVAVEAMRNGASDYLLKNNLTRLAPATLHAIEAVEAVRAKQASEAALTQSKERLRELAQHLQNSVEAERAAIAREVHDDVGGSLTALKFDIAWIARHAQDEAVRQRAVSALETVSHALDASKRIMHNLRPAILEQGLVAALQWMTSTFEKRTGIATSFHSSHEQMQLPAGVPLVAYRTAQEALTNVSKHAHATQVRVDLTLAGGVLTLEVCDNGRGFQRSDLAKARSFGIRGLHERAGTVGGWVELTSGPDGTTLILMVPLTEQPMGGEDAGLAPGRSNDDPTFWGDL